jgi:hypothetical protein
VKTLSEGSDCRCKCIVRPLSRSACRRIEEGAATAEDFYTVETVTSGPNCKKCACIAPPSALNPCEGDYRFKKLQEAGKDDIKVIHKRLHLSGGETTPHRFLLRTTPVCVLSLSNKESFPVEYLLKLYLI